MCSRKWRILQVCFCLWGLGCTSSSNDTNETDGSQINDDETSINSDGLACDLTLATLAPSEGFIFAGLDEEESHCTASSWEEVLPEDARREHVFVRNCAQESDGDGRSIFCDLASAATAVASFAQQQDAMPTIYVDPGFHEVAMEMNTQFPRLEIRGLCSGSTNLIPQNEEEPLFTVNAKDASLALYNVTVAASGNDLVNIIQGTVVLDNVRIEQDVDNGCFSVGSSAGMPATLNAKYVQFGSNAPTPEFEIDQIPEEVVPDDECDLPLPGDIPTCIVVEDGGVLFMENFELHDFSGVAVIVTGKGSSATLISGSIHDIKPLENNAFGYGLVVKNGASATLEDVSITSNFGAGAVVDGVGSSLSIGNSYLAETGRNETPRSGAGLVVQDQAQAQVNASKFWANDDTGIHVRSSASVTIEDADIGENRFVGVLISDADASITRSTVHDTVPSPSDGGGVGILLHSFDSERTLSVAITGNEISENPGGAVNAMSWAIGETAITIASNRITGNGLSGLDDGPRFPPSNITVLDTPGVTIQNNCIDSTGNQGILLRSSTAQLGGNVYQGTYDNAVYQDTYAGWVIHQQNCGDITVVDIGSEIFPVLSAQCLCGENTVDQEMCYPNVTVPELRHPGFCISEVPAVE